jgi:hypothetical protein
MIRINSISRDEDMVLDDQHTPASSPDLSPVFLTEQASTIRRYPAAANQSTKVHFLYVMTLSNIFIRVIECFTIESLLEVENKSKPNRITHNILHLLHASMFTFKSNNGLIALSDFYSYLSFCRAVMATATSSPIPSMVLYKTHQGSRYRFDYIYNKHDTYQNEITIQSNTYATVHQFNFSNSRGLTPGSRKAMCMMFSLIKCPGERHDGDEAQSISRYFYDMNSNEFKLMFDKSNKGYIEVNDCRILVKRKYYPSDPLYYASYASHTPFLLVANGLKGRYELVSLVDFFYKYFDAEIQPSSEFLSDGHTLTYIAYSPRRVLFHESGLTFMEALYNSQTMDWENKIDVFVDHIKKSNRSLHWDQFCYWVPLFICFFIAMAGLLAIPFYFLVYSNIYINADITALRIVAFGNSTLIERSCTEPVNSAAFYTYFQDQLRLCDSPFKTHNREDGWRTQASVSVDNTLIGLPADRTASGQTRLDLQAHIKLVIADGLGLLALKCVLFSMYPLLFICCSSIVCSFGDSFHNSYSFDENGNWSEQISLEEGPQKMDAEEADPPKFSTLYLRCGLWKALERRRDADLIDHGHYPVTMP